MKMQQWDLAWALKYANSCDELKKKTKLYWVNIFFKAMGEDNEDLLELALKKLALIAIYGE